MVPQFKYYQIVLTNQHKEKFSFTYELFNHRPAQIWAKITSKVSASNLRPDLNSWRGINKDWNLLFNELKIVVNQINVWVTHKLKISSLMNIQETLNQLHIHFPNSKDIDDPIKQQQLTRFNDLLHEIEQLHTSKIFNKEFLYILLCADNFDMYDLEYEDYKYFDPNIAFGDLTLHYCHVGRHPYEVFIRNDIQCPEEHILPQSKISCFHTLRFFNNRFNPNKWKTFYENSNINWPYKIDDPKLALGYIKLGKLLYVNGERKPRDLIYQIARSCNTIYKWEFT